MIGFLGGTGPEGRGMALRLASAGDEVMIGSRDPSRAGEVAQRIKDRGKVENVRGGTNNEVAQESDTLFVTVPYDAQESLLRPLAPALAGKVVVSTVAPLVFAEGAIEAVDVPEGSAAAQAQTLLPNSRVVAAFQNISAAELWAPGRKVEGDVVVCSDHPDAKHTVMAIAPRIPSLRAVDGGGLANAHYVEEVTALLLNINRIYKARSMIRITGLNVEE